MMSPWLRAARSESRVGRLHLHAFRALRGGPTVRAGSPAGDFADARLVPWVDRLWKP